MRNRLKSALKTFRGGERGTVFPIVLIALLLTGLMVPPLMSLISTSLVTGQMYENNSYELYAADAGVMDATWFLQELHAGVEGLKDPDTTPEQRRQIEEAMADLFSRYDPDITSEQIEKAKASLFIQGGTYTYTLPEEMNGKTVTIRIVREGNGYIITSTATGIDGSTTTIETLVNYPPPPPPIMVAAGALNGNLKINADVGTVDRWLNIYANGDIEMIGSGQIYGDAYCTYGHYITQYPGTGGGFYGEERHTTELDLVSGVLPNRPTIITGSVTLSTPGKYELGPVYIMGDLTISGDATLNSVIVELKGTVWVSGKIKINDDAVVYGTYDITDIPSGMSAADANYLYSKYKTGDPYFLVSDYKGTGDAISINGNTPSFSKSGHEYKVEAIMYAPEGAIYVGRNAKVKRAVVGATVTIIGDSELNFPLPFERVPPYYDRMVNDYWKIY